MLESGMPLWRERFTSAGVTRSGMRSRERPTMSDQLRPQQGARPWLPAYDVTSRLLLNEYNIPLAGLIDQDGVTYLYACLLGELEDVNLWAYAWVGDAEIIQLTSL